MWILRKIKEKFGTVRTNLYTIVTIRSKKNEEFTEILFS